MRFKFHSGAASPPAAPAASAGTARIAAGPDGPRDEGDLVHGSAGGNAAAIAELYRRHGATVYRYAWLLTGSEAAAADVVQDTFIALFHRPNRFDPTRGSCAAYLCGIARHLAARQVDPRAASIADIEELVRGDAVIGEPLPLPPPLLAATERAQSLARLYAAIRQLPPHYRDVLVLAELQELSYAEVAAVAGIELGTVRSRLARARERLRELLLSDGARATEGSTHRS